MIEELLDNEHIIKVSKNSFGLAVMKKVIKFTEDFETRQNIMNVISKYTPQLVQDPYGNYVLQESLDNWHDTYPELHDDNDNCFFANVYKNIIGKIEKLSIQKFSSNVIEKCLERANDFYRRIFIREIIHGEPVAIMKNSYGNYVFQKALALARGIDKFIIVDVIFRNFPAIHDHKIKMKWVKLLKKNLKQEDVLEAEEDQDLLNLDIDSTINYSHKYKLINDELMRYDSTAPKKEKGKHMKKKGPNTQELSYANAQHPSIGGYPPPFSTGINPNMGYGGNDSSAPPMYVNKGMPPNGGNAPLYGSKYQYNMSYQGQPGPPFSTPGYVDNSQYYHPGGMAPTHGATTHGDGKNQYGYPEYYNKAPSSYMGQGSYPGSGYHQ